MKFETVNQIANEAKDQFSSYVPNWTVDEAAASIDYIAKNSSTKKEAAEALFDMWEEEGAEFAEWEITKEQFVAQLV